MGGIPRRSRWAWNAKSELISRHKKTGKQDPWPPLSPPPLRPKKSCCGPAPRRPGCPCFPPKKKPRKTRPCPPTLTTAAATQEKLLRARAASARLALLSTEEKNALLLAIAHAIETNTKSILAANREDVQNSGLEGAMRDRLLLTPSRVNDMASGVRDVAALPDPIGDTLAEWTKSNGLRIRKVRVPLGVVGIIYESCPNVTVDTEVLVLKTGNAIVLRSGKQAAQSNQRLVEIMTAVPGVPEGAIELLDSSTRQSVQELIK